ncbi:MAG: hypothetical protein AAGF97_11360 [Planctomycetota bacterium]
MNLGAIDSAVGRVRLLLVAIAIAMLTQIANATPLFFTDDFNGPGLDPAWNQAGNPASHPAVIAGTYDMTHVNGDPMGGTKLNRSTTGTLSSYTHEISVVLDPFGLTGGGGTQSDFKWKSFGPDGFMEFVLNSFGDMRLFHNNSTAGVGGDLQPNTNIGYSEGDLLTLKTVYDQGGDTIDVTYSLNGGPATPYYSGTGNGGSIGDVITNFVETEVFKWGTALPDQPIVRVDRWQLVPEPSAASIIGCATLGFLATFRRRWGAP